MKTFMRLLSTLTVVLCFGIIVKAEPVSPDIARQTAQQFLQARGLELQKETMRAPQRSISTNNNADYYVFNVIDQQGFVVISGDDCVGNNLVLGYTTHGSFDSDNVPENLQSWLNNMSGQIAQLRQLNLKAPSGITLYDDIAPLLTTMWNQGNIGSFSPKNPYNALSPVIDGILCPTGCTATALAQVLYYHRWPQEPIAAELPAYTTMHGMEVDALPPVAFDWDNMVDDYTQPTTDAQQLAVAQLMRYCGQLGQLDYTPTGSNALLYDFDLLINLFGYDQELHLASYSDYTVNGWYKLLYNELHEGRPIYYTGNSTSNGHAFVVDGYEVQNNEGYFHINWGWGGIGNGFYKLALLNPSNNGTGTNIVSEGYNIIQQALIGLQRAKKAPDHYSRRLYGKLWNIHNDGIPHQFAVVNTSYRPGTFTIALAELDDEGNIKTDKLYGEQTVEIRGYKFDDPKKILKLISLPEYLAEELTPGIHNLVFIHKEKESDAEWMLLYGPNCHIELTIGDDGLPIDTIFHPCPQLSVEKNGIHIDGIMQTSVNHIVTASISNTGDDDIITSIALETYLLKDDKLVKKCNFARTSIFSQSGSKNDISFYCQKFQEAGDYVLVIREGIDFEDLNNNLQLKDIEQIDFYLGHTTISVDELRFTCTNAVYKEELTSNNDTEYYVECTFDNGTSTDYDCGVLASLSHKKNDGTYEPIIINGSNVIGMLIQVKASSQTVSSIPIFHKLEPGDYSISLKMSSCFQADINTLKNDSFFELANMTFTVSNTTTIKEINRYSEDSQWFDLQGRRLNGIPAQNGLYINNDNKILIINNK